MAICSSYSLGQAHDRAASYLSRIEELLRSRSQSLSSAIEERGLYFRISIVGGCNLACPFCHNEGGPKAGTLDLATAAQAMEAAAALGFPRVQLTGGEPLIHPRVAAFVAAGRRFFSDVGLTTNGTYLPGKLPGLIEAGLTRLHISLQVESLAPGGDRADWQVPPWLGAALHDSAEGRYALQLNLPVPADTLKQAARFLETIASYGVDIKVFSILPEGVEHYPLEELEQVVLRENRRRAAASQRGRVFIRGYRPPTGLRCNECAAYDRCREQSHSLRLGVDGTLRPCLATREWDMPLTHEKLAEQLHAAALLALDYEW